jgi:hypothetical protein
MLRFRPLYGWGWRRDDETIDVPPPFSIDAEAGDRVEGALSESSHPLPGMWIELTIRARGAEPTYNVRAFETRGDGTPTASGFAALLP